MFVFALFLFWIRNNDRRNEQSKRTKEQMTTLIMKLPCHIYGAAAVCSGDRIVNGQCHGIKLAIVCWNAAPARDFFCLSLRFFIIFLPSFSLLFCGNCRALRAYLNKSVWRVRVGKYIKSVRLCLCLLLVWMACILTLPSRSGIVFVHRSMFVSFFLLFPFHKIFINNNNEGFCMRQMSRRERGKRRVGSILCFTVAVFPVIRRFAIENGVHDHINLTLPQNKIENEKSQKQKRIAIQTLLPLEVV